MPEVADCVHRARGTSAERLGWTGTIALPAGDQILLNATHLGTTPEREPIPADWNSIAGGMTVVGVITSPRHGRSVKNPF
jgi:shikimate dehydrogenase